MTGSLAGLRVLEIAAIGPVPFAGMLLSDMGAEVVRVDRPGSAPHLTPIDRGRKSVAIDLKDPAGRALLLDMAAAADVLLEGFRPGVMERLGLGPDEVLARNARLVYGRMTGFGQEGPLSGVAGHDINYVAVAGALDLIGPPDGPPLPPLNLVGDFGGGGMLLAFGVMTALHHARTSGQGQVVDAAMVDGVGLLMAMFYGLAVDGTLGRRGSNGLDGEAPYYGAYQTSDGGWMAVGAIEEHFYQAFLHGLGLDPSDVPDRADRTQWSALRRVLSERFRSRSRDEWSKVFEAVDGCVSPVLSLADIKDHPHHVARQALSTVDGVPQPAPAPRLSSTPGSIQGPPPAPGQHSRDVLTSWGIDPTSVDALAASGVVSQHDPST